MANGEDPIVHQQGTIPGMDTPFKTSQRRLEEFSGGGIDDFWSKVLSTPPTKGEVATYYPLSGLDLTGRYEYYAPYRDTEESYARGQSRWDKMANGLVKMGGLAVSTILENTVGLVAGVGKWINDGKFSSLYDNEFNRGLDNWNKSLENQFPHYYTHRELDAEWYEPSAWFTSNFLWDKVVKNLGFAMGAIGGGLAYSTALRGLGVSGWLVKQGKGLELLAAMDDVLPTASKANRMAAFNSVIDDMALKYGAKPFGQLLQKSDRILTAALATSGEASIEALHNLNEFRNNAIAEFTEKYGKPPSGEDLDRINEQAQNVGNWSFGLNTALLTATNYIQFPKIIGSSYKAEKNIANKIATQPLKRNVKTGAFESALPQAGVKKLLNKSYNAAGLLFAPVEAFEEGAQYSIQRGTENYFGKKMKGEVVNWLEDGLGYGVSQTLNTREGMENILIGGISGGIMTAGIVGMTTDAKGKTRAGLLKGGNIGERGVFGYGGKRKVATDEALAALNRSSFKNYIQDYTDAAKRAQVAQERRAMFIRQGDILESKEEEFDFTHDYLLPRVKYGKMAAVQQDINTHRQLASTPEGFQQLKDEGRAAQEDTQESFLARLAAVEEHANTVNNTYSGLNLKYAGIVDKDGKRKYSDKVIDRMVYAVAKIKDYDKRITQLSPNLSLANVNVHPMLETIAEGKGITKFGVEEALKNINENPSLNADTKDDLKRDLQDVLEMGLRREQFYKEYDRIRNNPEKHEPEVLTEEELKNPAVTYRDAELQIGREYSLKQGLIRDGNRLFLAPKMAILSRTLEGEYEVKLPTGRSTFLTPEELEKYDISDVPNDDLSLKAAMNAAIEKVFNKPSYKELLPNLPSTLEERVEYINSLNNQELVDDIAGLVAAEVKEQEKRKQKEAEELAEAQKKKAELEKIFKSQQALGTGVITLTPTAEDLQKDAEPRKKTARIVFASTTSASEDEVPDSQAPPRVVRERNFLFNQTFSKNKENFKIIVITANQEDKLALGGLVNSVANDDKDKDYTLTDVDKAPVLGVYVMDIKGVLWYIDENGKPINRVGERVDFNKLVISTLSNTSTTWRNGQSRFRKEDEKDADQYAAQWRKQREQFFNAETYSVFSYAVSRGLPVYDSFEEDGETQYRENPISGSLFPTKDKEKVLNNEGTIIVAVTDRISHNGVNYQTQIGRTYFQYGDKFAPITNRKLTQQEQDAAYLSLVEMTKQAANNKGIKGRYLNFLRGLLYFGNPVDADGKPRAAGRNQIWIDKQFFLNFGNGGQKIPFTPSSLQNNKGILTTYLAGVYNNVNNSLLKEHKVPFEEVIIDENGNLSSRQWKNYQHYLLEATFKGEKREALLKTPVRQLSSSVPNDRNFKQKYAILQGIDFKVEEAPKAQPQKKAEVPEKVADKEAIRVDLDDGYIIGTITPEGEVELIKFVFKGEDSPIVDKNRQALIDIFLEKIGRKPKVEEATPIPTQQQTSTPVAPKVKDIKIKDDRDEEYRIVSTLSVDRMGEQEKREFAAWMKTNLPQFTVEEIDQLIRTTGDRQAWGRLQGKVIALYKQAEKGTGYHEAFEGVWKYFLSPEEQEALYDEVKGREGQFQDRETGEFVEYKEATEKQVKEKLADEFADYKTGKKPSLTENIVNFFKRIVKFFRTFLTGYKPNTTLVNDLFSRIEKGSFAKYRLPKVLDTSAEYRAIKGLTAAQTHGFVQDITVRFFMELFKEGVDMFEKENYNRNDIFEKIHRPETIAELPEGQKTYDELVKKVKEKLNTYHIRFDENGVVSINDEGVDRVQYDSSSQKMMLDVRKTQPFGVRLLLASLYKTNGELKADGSPIATKGLVNNYELLPIARTTVTLLDAMVGATDIDDMIDRLRKLTEENTDYIRILTRLGKKNEGGGIDFDNLTIEQWRMLSGFYDSFNKQRPYVEEFVNENDGVFFRDMFIGSAARANMSYWESNIRRNARNGKAIFLPYDKKEKHYKIDAAKLAEYKKKADKSLDGRLEFLNDLGIAFPKEVYTKLEQPQKDAVTNATNKIFKYMSDKGGLRIVKADIFGINGPMSAISEVYTKATRPDAESTFANGEGQQQQVYIQPNYTSFFENVFNSVGDIDELKERLPWLNDVYSRSSEVLKLGGDYFNEDGTRTSTPIKNGYINTTTTNGRRKLLKDADYQERLNVQINSILKGVFYISVPGDASTEYNITLPQFISYKELLNKEVADEKITDRMIKYLEDEISVAKENRKGANIGDKGNQLRFFKDILSPTSLRAAQKLIDGEIEKMEVNRDIIKADILAYIDRKVAAFTKNLRYNGLVEVFDDNTYSYPGLLSSYADTNNINKDSMSQEEYENVTKQIWFNNFVAQTELHKVLFGDPYNFAIKGKVLDETKRIKSFLSPAQPTLVSKYYNNKFNQVFNTVGETTLNHPLLGEYIPVDWTNSTTISEVEIVADIFNTNKEYSGIKEADAQALHTILMHRDLETRHYKWGKDKENWIQFEEAYRRLRMNKKGQLPDDIYPEELRKHDEELIGWDGDTNTKQRPEKVFFEVKKPIVRGIKEGREYIDPVMDKFSSAPIWYSGVEGTVLEDLYVKMLKEQTDYIILESGRKVGAEEYHNFYSPDGSFNTEPFNNNIQVNWGDYYIQQENVYDDSGRQTRGSQITKMFSLDMFSGGEAIDADPEIVEKGKYNDKLLEELTIDGYTTLLRRLGLKDNETYFSVENKERLMKTLRDESFKRDMPDNTRDIFKPDPVTGEYNIAMEATSEYVKIQKMLYAIVDREVLTQKYNGGQKTQMSVLGWESRSKGRDLVIKDGDGYKRISRKEYKALSEDDKKNVRITSSRLKFYTREDRYMEVLLPNWFRRQLDPKNRKTDKELMAYLHSTAEGKKILQGVGFRIPTQAMSQIEAIRVAGFLAPEYGDTVVVPSEITTKAGSDFDIDKLNTYLKNVYIDGAGNPHLFKIYKIDTNNEEQLKDFYEDNLLERYKKQKGVEKEVATRASVEELFDTLGIESEEENIGEELVKRYVPSLDEFILEAKGKDSFELNKTYHREFRKALENEYIENLEWFITHPKNFDRLITPTTQGELKGLADEIAVLTGTEETEDLTKLLDINYLSSLRQAFMSAKRWIGIVVNGITSHAQAQRTNLYIDVANTPLTEKDKEILGIGNILLPHIADEQGRPSLSGIVNTIGTHISDILSWFTTAMVDVSKDPYITTIIHNKKLVPTFTFLTRIGVPTNTLVYFMNQPIIREYMRFSDEMGFSKVANPYWRDEEFLPLNKFPAKKIATELDTKIFKNTIERYYKGEKLTEEENQQQLLILNEFLKYFRMSEHLFNFTQATNWDTADFKTGGAVFKKQAITYRENKNNIVKTPARILNNSFLGKVAESMIYIREAMGALSKFEGAEVRNELDNVLRHYALLTGYVSPETMEKIDSAIISSFVDYLIQTKTGLNSTINFEFLLIQESTSVAEKIKAIREDPELLKSFNNNPIFSYLKDQTHNSLRGGDNVLLRPFPKQVYDKDLVTDGLRELREMSLDDNGEIIKTSLYSGIVRLALLQGSGNASNLLSFVPIEDFAKAISPVISSTLKEEAKQYAENRNFERNKWTDDDVVPEFTPVITSSKYKGLRYNLNFPFTEWGGKVMILKDTFNSKEVEYPVLKVRRAPMIKRSPNRFNFMDKIQLSRDMIKQMVGKGDYSFNDHIGYQKVFLPNGEPLTKTFKEKGKWVTAYYYKMVNLMGDRNIQEHYTDNRASILDNATVHIPQEDIIPDEVIINRILGKGNEGKEPPSTPTPPITPTPTPVVATAPEATFPEITEIKRSGKKEKYNITLVHKKGFGTEVVEREGYRLTIKEYPEFQGFIHGNAKDGWQVDEVTTSQAIGRTFSTAKEALEDMKTRLNQIRTNEEIVKRVQAVGIFTTEEMKSKLGFKKGPCK